MKKIATPFANAMGLRYRSHPWHGIEIGADVPNLVTCFIEIVPTDSVKYEIDKASGYLKIDRPMKYSASMSALYGFIPQTYCGKNVAAFVNISKDETHVVGDEDPLDICVLTEKPITHGDIIVEAIPIGGISLIDGNEADDKIIAVMKNDAVYGKFKDISDCPEDIITRLKHYFLTYKDMPGQDKRDCEIRRVYGSEEAKKIILASMKDYKGLISDLIFS